MNIEERAKNWRNILFGVAQIGAGASLIFSTIYTIAQPFTALKMAFYLGLISAASVYIVLGFERIADELDRRKPES